MPLDSSEATDVRCGFGFGATQGRSIEHRIAGLPDAVVVVSDHVRETALDEAPHDEHAITWYIDCLSALDTMWLAAAPMAALYGLESDVHYDATPFLNYGWSVRPISTSWSVLHERTPAGYTTSYIPAFRLFHGGETATGEQSRAGNAPSDEPARQSRYPLLGAAIAEGRIKGEGLPAPGSRHLRVVEETEATGEDGQVGFGRSGEPPREHVRRTHVP